MTCFWSLRDFSYLQGTLLHFYLPELDSSVTSVIVLWAQVGVVRFPCGRPVMSRVLLHELAFHCSVCVHMTRTHSLFIVCYCRDYWLGHFWGHSLFFLCSKENSLQCGFCQVLFMVCQSMPRILQFIHLCSTHWKKYQAVFSGGCETGLGPRSKGQDWPSKKTLLYTTSGFCVKLFFSLNFLSLV